MSKVILVRHGRTAWHAEGRYAGTADVPLDDVGQEQAKRVARRFKGQKIEAIYSSPLSRCLDLAKDVAEIAGLEVKVDERLREIDLGRWDGELLQSIVQKDGEMLRQWIENPVSTTIPGGEPLIAVQDRAMDWLAAAVREHGDGTILASSHGGPIRAILAGVMGLPLSHLFRLTVDLASVSIVNYMGEFSNIKLLNSTVHLGDRHAEGFF